MEFSGMREIKSPIFAKFSAKNGIFNTSSVNFLFIGKFVMNPRCKMRNGKGAIAPDSSGLII